ncbi:hypothetical protein VNO77_02702 [Canavalia gladiata]|uniref:Uncharacterized protein n=1 Tax=Canavalia gladiata TaxID=3824 RepID=A0AAN9RBI5_CANGL
MIWTKGNAVQEFLKKDIVNLLRSTLDYNAYGKAERLLVEQDRDCPDERKEAIPSGMGAAASQRVLASLWSRTSLTASAASGEAEEWFVKLSMVMWNSMRTMMTPFPNRTSSYWDERRGERDSPPHFTEDHAVVI